MSFLTCFIKHHTNITKSVQETLGSKKETGVRLDVGSGDEQVDTSD